MNDQTRQAMQIGENVAEQCKATASSVIAQNILVDEGSGTLRELLSDAANTITALREALNTRSSSTHSDAEYSEVAQPQGEPVAWGYFDADGSFMDAVGWQHGAYQTPLYTTPPSVEAMRIETLEKAAKLLESGVLGHGECAAAIRSMN